MLLLAGQGDLSIKSEELLVAAREQALSTNAIRVSFRGEGVGGHSPPITNSCPL